MAALKVCKKSASSKGTKQGDGKNEGSLKKVPTKTASNDGNKDENSSIGVVHLLLAVLALAAGILTPPLLSIYRPGLTNFMTKMQMGGNETVAAAIDIDESTLKYMACNQENLSQFLQEQGNPGVHILCFAKDGNLKIYVDSQDETDFGTWQGFQEFAKACKIKPHDVSNTQPWAIFSTEGERLTGELDAHDGASDVMYEHGMVLLFEGGSWVWPGVSIGFKRTVNLLTGHSTDSTTTLEIETLSMKPLVLSVKNFISETECDHIQEAAKPQMQYSEVSLMDHDKGRPASDFRTSQSAFLHARDEVMHALEARTASLTRIPKNHQEHTQVLRYGKTEKYSAHLDYFDPMFYKEDKGTMKLIDSGKRNRLATVFWYLSDVEAGGHTVFPRFGGAPQPWNFEDCTKGLLVKPEKGKVIIFYSLLPNGHGDQLSLHGACPVQEGIKWAANKWIWNAPMGFVH